MKPNIPCKPHPRGFVSYVLVLSAGAILTLLTMAAYRGAIASQVVQSETQIRVDYAEKEEAVLRAIVNITPNRAIRAMQSGSNDSDTTRLPMRWQTIFDEALTQSNARTSVSAALLAKTGATGGIVANATDSALTDINSMFDAIEPEPGYVSPGVNRSLGVGFPVPLQCSAGLKDKDDDYPLIAAEKIYGTLASGKVGLSVVDYPNVNRIPYPDIRFGYSAPGQPFVAKRNWWAFSMQLGEDDQILKSFAQGNGDLNERDFVLSIYEIPSQLAISAEAFANLGTHADGTAWQNDKIHIEGGVYATRAQLDSGMKVDRLSGRRGLTLASGVEVGDKPLAADPFAPGAREEFEDNFGKFQPIALASESGRSTFIPINRGADFFDRFAHAAESNTISTTSWNNYSVGALQCAMRVDVTAVTSSTNPTPTMLRFGYLNGTTRQTLNIPQTYAAGVGTTLQSGYTFVANENASYNFGTQIVDVAYGAGTKFYYKFGVTGTIAFNNANFGDPLVGTPKAGYWRPSCPFEVKLLRGTKRSIAVYPERLPAFVTALGGSGPAINNSLAVNVDYSNTGLNNINYKPKIPCLESDYGVLLTECDNLTVFPKGFSLVTNLRLYIGDDFNVTSTTVPAGSGLASPFYPPASLFAPEKRYGTDFDPFRVQLSGQMGHLGGDTGENGAQVHLLDLKMGSESSAGADKIDVNLRPITHPAELPPITMMNWLITIEERRKSLYTPGN